MEAASSMLKDALQTILRHLLAENLEALKESGELPDVEALKNLGKGLEPEAVRELIREEIQSFREVVSEEIRSALEQADIPTVEKIKDCLLYTSPSPRDVEESRMPSSA